MYDGQQWILKRAQLTPDKKALIEIETKRYWTYRQLTKEIEKWQRILCAHNIQIGDRVCMMSENNIDTFAVLFACGLQGAIFVPINWRLSEQEIVYVVTDCKPQLCIYEHTFASIVENLPVPHKWSLSEQLGDRTVQLSSFSSWQPTKPWLIIYTGGTTGHPKGVVLSFESVNWNAINTIVSWNLTNEDCTINYMPLFHTGGINALAVPLLMAGGTVVVGKKFNAEIAARALNEYHSTISLFVPTMYQELVQTEYFQQAHFPTVKVFLSGGAPCPQTIYETFHQKGLLFKEGYGLTEAGPNNFYIDPIQAVKKRGAVGKSMQFNQIRIVKADGSLCAIGEVGELQLRGKHLFKEYWENEQATKAAFSDGWFKTGDLAKMDEQQDVYIVGRKKEMIISGGENIYPQEVEQCIIQHPNVKEVAVIGIPDEYWGEIVAACIVCKQEVSDFEAEIRISCTKQLGKYKIPKKIFLLNELPRTTVGKIDKIKLKQAVILNGCM
ncbi:AMP-binding protein [Lysinibacillus sp. KU-BSD001]|uniref:class I adenylate-forming enzyme family protein n=1 Tax=Lysinibacillus sp. KU-BSD001 TaxID=3141328 RepID=UPI0036EDA510